MYKRGAKSSFFFISRPTFVNGCRVVVEDELCRAMTITATGSSAIATVVAVVAHL